MDSIAVIDGVASVKGTPNRWAARASSSSPSYQVRPAIPVGAMASGMAIGLPKSCVWVLRVETSTSTLLRILMRRNAARFSERLTSSSEPRSKNSNTPLGRRRFAAIRRSSMFW